MLALARLARLSLSSVTTKHPLIGASIANGRGHWAPTKTRTSPRWSPTRAVLRQSLERRSAPTLAMAHLSERSEYSSQNKVQSVSHVPWFRRTLVLFPTTCFARVLGKPSLTPPRLGLVVVECTPQKISGRLFFLAIRTRIRHDHFV